MPDILIKNGWIFNGRSENILTKSDLLIHDGKVQSIGTIEKIHWGTKIINGEGRIISPGFIDLNSRLDNDTSEDKLWDDASFLRQGITTVIMGSNGRSLFKPFLVEKRSSIKLETRLSSGNNGDKMFLAYNKYFPNINLGSFLGWTTLNDWGIHNASQLNIFLNQIKGYFAGLSLEFRETNREENLKTLNELVPLLGKRAKNLILFFPDNLPDELLIQTLGQLSLHNHVDIAFDCPLLGCLENSERILPIVEKENEKGANLIFKLWPYSFIQYSLGDIDSLLETKVGGIKNIETAALSSYLFGSDIPSLLRRKTLDEIKNNWSVDLRTTLEKIKEIAPENHFKILLPYHLSEDWWHSSFTYVSVDSNLVSADSIDGPNIFSGINYFLESQLSGTPADQWPQTLAKITSQPASFIGLANRGFLQKDYLADIVIINPDKLKGNNDYQNPTLEGGGIEEVIMNGQIIWQKDRVWKRKVGKLLI